MIANTQVIFYERWMCYRDRLILPHPVCPECRRELTVTLMGTATVVTHVLPADGNAPV